MLKRTTFYLLVLLLCPAPLALAQVAPAPAPASVPAQAAPARPAANEYVIGPQDSLRIVVFDEPTLSGSFKVDAEGVIQYPFLGRVPVAGLTLTQVGAALSKQLETGFVRRAQVAVEVETLRVRSIFVIGEVKAPGKYPMGAQMTVLEALAAAGSTNPTAGGDVMILRGTMPGSAPLAPGTSPEDRTVRISLNDLQLGRDNPVLQEGDTVFVQKAEKFYVTGQVKSPGAYTFERNLSVLQALALAGGVTDKGSTRRMRVIRIVNGKKAEIGIDETDTVEPGDTIVVPQRFL